MARPPGLPYGQRTVNWSCRRGYFAQDPVSRAARTYLSAAKKSVWSRLPGVHAGEPDVAWPSRRQSDDS
jgi:hypothetical protein